jgi:GH24 family phage-related lysozyme (muramidase)
MADVRYSAEEPTTTPLGGENVRQEIRANPDAFGAATAEAAGQFGGKLSQIGGFYDKVAADTATTSMQRQIDAMAHGDPSDLIQGPNGQMIPKPGYFSAQGFDKVSGYQGFMEGMDSVIENHRNQLSPQAQLEFDRESQRIRSMYLGHAGTVYDQGLREHAVTTNTLSMQNAESMIQSHPDDPAFVDKAIQQYGDSAWKTAALHGATLEQEDQVRRNAISDLQGKRIQAIGATDPARALKMIDEHKEVLGDKYPEMKQRFEDTWRKNAGDLTARSAALSVPFKPPTGDALQLIRDRESFRDQPYWDVNHHRVGYGSDTVTRADGRVEVVTPFTKISREDAERDLSRRVGEYQKGIRQDIGDNVWSSLPPAAQASLTSIAYNYGHLPASVAKAAQTGDVVSIANAIRARAGDNDGVNQKRRNIEADNVLGNPAQMDRFETAINNVRSRTDMDPWVQAHAINSLKSMQSASEVDYAQQDRARKEMVRQADDEYIQTLGGGGDLTALRAKVLSDPRYAYEPHNRKVMLDFIQNKAIESGSIMDPSYGPKSADVHKRIFLPVDDPNRINDMGEILQMAAPGGGLTSKGAEYFTRVLNGRNKDPNYAALHASFAKIMEQVAHDTSYARDDGYVKLRDPDGQRIYNVDIFNPMNLQFAKAVEAGEGPKFLEKLYENSMTLSRTIRPEKQKRYAEIRELSSSVPEGAEAAKIPAPEGIAQEKWQPILSAPPIFKNNKIKTGTWAKVLTTLISNPSPDMIKAFDEQYGDQFTAEDVLKKLGVSAAPPEQPAAPAQSKPLEGWAPPAEVQEKLNKDRAVKELHDKKPDWQTSGLAPWEQH